MKSRSQQQQLSQRRILDDAGWRSFAHITFWGSIFTFLLQYSLVTLKIVLSEAEDQRKEELRLIAAGRQTRRRIRESIASSALSCTNYRQSSSAVLATPKKFKLATGSSFLSCSLVGIVVVWGSSGKLRFVFFIAKLRNHHTQKKFLIIEFTFYVLSISFFLPASKILLHQLEHLANGNRFA